MNNVEIKIESKKVECAEYKDIIFEEKKDGTKIYKKVP